MEPVISAAVRGLIMTVALVGAVACSVQDRSPADQVLDQPSLMQRLETAEISDRGNATAFTWSAPGLDHYYNRKADEVEDVMRRLQAGQDVPPDEIGHALDNSLATTWGVPAY